VCLGHPASVAEVSNLDHLEETAGKAAVQGPGQWQPLQPIALHAGAAARPAAPPTLALSICPGKTSPMLMICCSRTLFLMEHAARPSMKRNPVTRAATAWGAERAGARGW
jgi:hypothetical protein